MLQHSYSFFPLSLCKRRIFVINVTKVLFLRNKTHVDSHASRAISYRCGVQHAAGTQMAVSYPTAFLAASLSLPPKSGFSSPHQPRGATGQQTLFL